MTTLLRTLSPLLACAGLLSAVDLPKPDAVLPLLAGTWTVLGYVNLDDGKAVPNRANLPMQTAVIQSATMAFLWEPDNRLSMPVKVLAVSATGIDLSTSGGFTGPRARKSQIIIVEDGILLCEQRGVRMGLKLVRADGKPVGLPPSIAPAAVALAATRAAVAATQAAALAEQFTVELTQISIGKSVSFRDGDLAEPQVNGQSSLQFQVRIPKGITVLGQGGEPSMATATTDTGESLVPPKSRDRNSHYNGGGNVHQDRMWVSIQLGQAEKPVAAFIKLAGTIPVKVQTEAGPVISIPLTAASVGVEQALTGTEHRVTIEKIGDHQVTIKVPHAARTSIIKQTLVDADGNELEGRGTNSTGDGENYSETKRLAEDPPVGATLRIEMAGGSTVVNVPFSFENVGLTAAGVPAAAGGEPLF